MYREAFGGRVTALLTYGEVNDPAYTLTEEQKNWIYHGQYTYSSMDDLIRWIRSKSERI